jgi:hypothetical protein
MKSLRTLNREALTSSGVMSSCYLQIPPTKKTVSDFCLDIDNLFSDHSISKKTEYEYVKEKKAIKAEINT